MRGIEPEPLFQALGEEREAARDQQRLQAGCLDRAQHRLAAHRDGQAFFIYPFERARVESLKQRDAADQAFGKFQLAAHGRLGDCGHLWHETLHIGDFVDALDGDQGRIHVHRYQAEVTERAARRDEGGVQARRAGGQVDRLL